MIAGAVAIGLVLALAGTADAEETTFSTGSITFTQGGTQAKWSLWEGSATATSGARVYSLIFSAEPKDPRKMPRALFRLSFSKMGETVEIAALSAENGPGGPGRAVHRLPKSKCAITLKREGADGAEGAGTCSGNFEGGPTVTRLAFTVGK